MAMREIKFRAWDKEQGEMIFNLSKILRYSHTSSGMQLVCDKMVGDDYIEYPIMQYTGLKDKNGIEIYEGDIVKFYYTSGAIENHTIIFFEGYFAFDNRTHSSLSPNSKFCEVIGNIYENPELLEQ